MTVHQLGLNDQGKCFKFEDGRVCMLAEVYEDMEDFYKYKFIDAYGNEDRDYPLGEVEEVNCD